MKDVIPLLAVISSHPDVDLSRRAMIRLYHPSALFTFFNKIFCKKSWDDLWLSGILYLFIFCQRGEEVKVGSHCAPLVVLPSSLMFHVEKYEIAMRYTGKLERTWDA